MILLIDNYDSFVHTLARYGRELGHAVAVVRNDAIDAAGVRARAPSHLIVSPGPCGPAEAGNSTAIVRALAPELPILGVCLGHQCLAAAFGGHVVRGRPVHGKTSPVRHDGGAPFTGLAGELAVTRYHSLIVSDEGLPDELVVSARTTDDGTIMALRHRRYPALGVQFHPEAVLTQAGHGLLRNFLALGAPEPEAA